MKNTRCFICFTVITIWKKKLWHKTQTDLKHVMKTSEHMTIVAWSYIFLMITVFKKTEHKHWLLSYIWWKLPENMTIIRHLMAKLRKMKRTHRKTKCWITKKICKRKHDGYEKTIQQSFDMKTSYMFNNKKNHIRNLIWTPDIVELCWQNTGYKQKKKKNN